MEVIVGLWQQCQQESASFEERLSAIEQADRLWEEFLRHHSPDTPEALRLRTLADKCYVVCLLGCPEESAHAQLDARWWRLLYHGPIDQYRRQLKQEGLDRERLQNIAFELTRLITQAVGSLQQVVHGLAVRYAVVALDGLWEALGQPAVCDCLSASETLTSEAPSPVVEALLYRLLIGLGDLLRYRAQYDARACIAGVPPLSRLAYEVARDYCPQQGHAWNMLAVQGDESHPKSILLAYGRALACAHPFPAALTNLQVYLRRSHGEHGWIKLARWILSTEENLPPLDWLSNLSNAELYSLGLFLLCMQTAFAERRQALQPVISHVLSVALDCLYRDPGDDQLLLLVVLLAHAHRRHGGDNGSLAEKLRGLSKLDPSGLAPLLSPLEGLPDLEALLMKLSEALSHEHGWALFLDMLASPATSHLLGSRSWSRSASMASS